MVGAAASAEADSADCGGAESGDTSSGGTVSAERASGGTGSAGVPGGAAVDGPDASGSGSAGERAGAGVAGGAAAGVGEKRDDAGCPLPVAAGSPERGPVLEILGSGSVCASEFSLRPSTDGGRYSRRSSAGGGGAPFAPGARRGRGAAGRGASPAEPSAAPPASMACSRSGALTRADVPLGPRHRSSCLQHCRWRGLPRCRRPRQLPGRRAPCPACRGNPGRLLRSAPGRCAAAQPRHARVRSRSR